MGKKVFCGHLFSHSMRVCTKRNFISKKKKQKKGCARLNELVAQLCEPGGGEEGGEGEETHEGEGPASENDEGEGEVPALDFVDDNEGFFFFDCFYRKITKNSRLSPLSRLSSLSLGLAFSFFIQFFFKKKKLVRCMSIIWCERSTMDKSLG